MNKREILKKQQTDIYPLPEAATILRLDRSTLRRAINSGEIQSVPYQHPTGWGLGIPQEVLEDFFGGEIEPVLTTKEVSNHLGLQRETVTNWCVTNRIPAIQISGAYRIKQSTFLKIQHRRPWERW